MKIANIKPRENYSACNYIRKFFLIEFQYNLFCNCSLFSITAVPTYCWVELTSKEKVPVKEMPVEFEVSINRSGSTYPNYISKQCAIANINGSNGKLKMSINALHDISCPGVTLDDCVIL